MTSSVGVAGLRVRPVTMAGEHLLPVMAPLVPLFPEGGLRRGSTLVVTGTMVAEATVARATAGAGATSLAVAVGVPATGTVASVATAGAGATSLAVAVGAAASQAGSWCAAVGWPALGMVAAAGLGVALERFALVPHPGDQWAAVTAALIDAVDVILLRPPRGVRSADARRLTARVRERGVVLVVCRRGRSPAWPDVVDLSLSVVASPWRGLGQGHGYLQARSVEVASTGRGAASRERRVRLLLPGNNGSVCLDRVAPVAASSDSPASASASG